jgi:alanyl-tRNA synthetase
MINGRLFFILARRVLLVACLPIALGGVVLAQRPGGSGGMGMGRSADTTEGTGINIAGGVQQPGAVVIEMPQITKVDHELKQLNKLLALTADQQAQVKDILTGENQKIEELVRQFKAEQQKQADAQKAKPASNQQQKGIPPGNIPNPRLMENARAILKNIRNEAQTKIVAQLTDSQKTAYDAWKAKRAKSEAERAAEEFRPVNSNGGPVFDAADPGGRRPGGSRSGGGGPG